MSVGRQQSLRLNIAISSGTGTGALVKAWDIVRWLRVIPVAESDTYTLTVKDADGHIMLKRTSQLGTFSENIEMSLGIMKTVLIEDATQDGTYIVKLDMH